jgi:hypothetical protein
LLSDESSSADKFLSKLLEAFCVAGSDGWKGDLFAPGSVLD